MFFLWGLENETMSKNNCFEVTGQLEHFTESLKDALIEWCSKNHYDYAYIYHDKDIKHNDDTNEDELKPNHLHFMVNTGSSRWTFQMLLDRFSALGMKSTMLQKVRKGWNNALSYLVHRTEGAVNDGKHLYELKEVVASFDYQTTIGVIEEQVEEKKTRIDEVIELINSLVCRQFNIHQFISIEDYTKKGNKQKIDMAFSYVETRLREEKKGRDMEVYWIYGKPGIGKTTLAKIICKNKKWSFAISSSSNDPLQDYEGQDALILDDFRPNGWTKSDVLKMFDNNTASSIKSRYQNKQTCYLRAIIVTTVLAPYELWVNWDSGSKEPFEQLSRRVTQEIEMYKDVAEGDFAHTYFTVKGFDNVGESSTKRYDFTKHLEKIRAEAEAERKKRESAFADMDCVDVVSSSNVKKPLEASKLVDDKDVPF